MYRKHEQEEDESVNESQQSEVEKEEDEERHPLSRNASLIKDKHEEDGK